ncbi:MAG: YtxH domain-containing protein [Anaerolineae bacterium]|jgi:gas vesicle protein
MRRAINFLTGFLVGAVVGGVTGLLLTPSGGSELQEQIKTRLETLVEEGRKAAAARRSELEAQLEAFRSGEPVSEQVASE